MPNCFAKNTLGIPLTNRPRITYWTFADDPRYTRVCLSYILSQDQTFYKGKTNTAFPGAFPKKYFSLSRSISPSVCEPRRKQGEGRDNIAFDLADEGASVRKTILHRDLRWKQQVAQV